MTNLFEVLMTRVREGDEAAWKKLHEVIEELQQPDGIFGQIQDRIQFMLDHNEVASKAWYLDELKGLFTFVELKQREILGDSEK